MSSLPRKGTILDTILVTYDSRSGRIVSVNIGGAEAGAERLAENISEITVTAKAVEPGKLYTVDVDRKALVETKHQDGVGFTFGQSAKSAP